MHDGAPDLIDDDVLAYPESIVDQVEKTGNNIPHQGLCTEADGDSDAYITSVIEDQLPAIVAAGLADAVDAFCEGIGFSNEQTRRIFDAASTYGLPVKLHAEQLSNLGGAALAAEFGALSADHLEFVDEAGIQAMARAGTVAVISDALRSVQIEIVPERCDQALGN